MKELIKKKFGDKAFYAMVLGIALPIMIQNGISNFVGMLDNLMIGRVGTNALSGVAIANQLIFVYYLVIFGATAGAGIFTAQYYGMGNTEGVRQTFRFKLIANTILSLVCICILFFFSEPLISLFLNGEGKASDAAETLVIGREYMYIMLIGLIPNGLTNAYAGTLRETGETKVPMVASFVAVFVNLIGNFLLIYGYLGFPKMGASGAAVATIISRSIELLVLVVYTQTHSSKHPFIIGAFRHFYVPMNLVGKLIVKSLPLICNETLWALGMTVMNQCYSYRSLNAVASINIQSTIWNLMGVSFLAMGDAVGIIVGQQLGSGDIDKAKENAVKLRSFTTFCGITFGLLLAAISGLFPELYNTSDEIKKLATELIIASGFAMPIQAFMHASYFIIRSGGRTGITMIFDSCFVWVVSVPVAFVLSRYTGVGVLIMYIIIQSLELIKCVIGYIIVNSGIWAKNLVKE